MHTPSLSRAESGSEALFLAKVYALVTYGVSLTALVAWFVVSHGPTEAITMGDRTFEVSSTVAALHAHPLLTGLTFLGCGLLALLGRRTQGLGFLSFSLLSVAAGALVGPAVAYASMRGHEGLALVAHPVRDAGLLTVGTFTALSAYALATRRDFSFLGAGLFMGLSLLLVGLVLNLFLGSAVLDLALASVGVIVFAGYVLLDTSHLLHGPQEDAVGEALQLYLDVLNLFVSLLRIFSSGSKD